MNDIHRILWGRWNKFILKGLLHVCQTIHTTGVLSWAVFLYEEKSNLRERLLWNGETSLIIRKIKFNPGLCIILHLLPYIKCGLLSKNVRKISLKNMHDAKYQWDNMLFHFMEKLNTVLIILREFTEFLVFWLWGIQNLN